MKCLACSTPSSDSLSVAHWETLAVDTSNGYQLLQDVDGGPLEGVAGRSSSVHHRVLKMMSMTGPWGALPVGPAASATEF
jgi:hypothetical protein